MLEQKQIITDDGGKWTAIVSDDSGTQIITEYKSQQGTIFDRNKITLTPAEAEAVRWFLNRCDILMQYEKYDKIKKEE